MIYFGGEKTYVHKYAVLENKKYPKKGSLRKLTVTMIKN